jgi:hypothetical protein
VRETLVEFGFTAHIRSRGEEGQALTQEVPIGIGTRRWVVERSHSWLNRFRRILMRWDKNPKNYLGFLISPVPSSRSALPEYSDRLLVHSPVDFDRGLMLV